MWGYIIAGFLIGALLGGITAPMGALIGFILWLFIGSRS